MSIKWVMPSSHHISLSLQTAHGVLKVRMQKRFTLPSPGDHVLSELSAVTCPSRVALHGMADSFIESRK